MVRVDRSLGGSIAIVVSPSRRRVDNLMRRLGVRGACVTVVVAVAFAGCGVGEKDEHATRIRASRAVVAESAPATGQLRFELGIDEELVNELESTQRAQVEAALAAGAAPRVDVSTIVDGASRRATISLDPGSPEPATVFVDTEMFAKRRNARPSERRTWARLDLEDLTEAERPLDTREMTASQVLTAVASTLNPAYLLDLVEGTLTGSVEVRGTELIREVETTRYAMNISLEKALTELDFDDQQQEVRTRLFRMLGSRQEVIPARAWIDTEGRLRRLELELEQRVTRRRKNTLNVRLELASFGGEAALAPPAQESTVTYERFGRLVRSVLPEEA